MPPRGRFSPKGERSAPRSQLNSVVQNAVPSGRSWGSQKRSCRCHEGRPCASNSFPFGRVLAASLSAGTLFGMHRSRRRGTLKGFLPASPRKMPKGVRGHIVLVSKREWLHTTILARRRIAEIAGRSGGGREAEGRRHPRHSFRPVRVSPSGLGPHPGRMSAALSKHPWVFLLDCRTWAAFGPHVYRPAQLPPRRWKRSET